jgi:hypothetical protein
MKSESGEHSLNTNPCFMIVKLEALLASQARIMKYGSMEKFLSIELEENICLRVIRQPWWDSRVPHRLGLQDGKWIFGRWGVVLTSSHLQRHCHMLCHARGIVHLLWIMDSVENHESRSNSRENCQTQKCIFDI